MRYASSQCCKRVCRCKCIYVTAPPVCSSGPVAPRMRILLLSVSGTTKAPKFISRPLTFNTTKTNVLLMFCFKQLPSRDARHKNISPLCKNQPFKCTVCFLIFASDFLNSLSSVCASMLQFHRRLAVQ